MSIIPEPRGDVPAYPRTVRSKARIARVAAATASEHVAIRLEEPADPAVAHGAGAGRALDPDPGGPRPLSLSGGLRNLVGDTLSKIQGVIVLRENALSPVFSDLPADLAREDSQTSRRDRRSRRRSGGSRRRSKDARRWARPCRAHGVASGAVARGPEPADPEHARPADRSRARTSPRTRTSRAPSSPARWWRAASSSRETSRHEPHRHQPEDRQDFADPDRANPGASATPSTSADEPFEIIGIYDTGSMFLDVVIIMDIDDGPSRSRTCRTTTSSTFYVEADDPAHNEELSALIETSFDDRRRPEPGRDHGELRQPDGPARPVPADDGLPGPGRRRRRHRQHDADEHDRAVRRVRRPAHQRLVARARLALVSAESAYLGLLGRACRLRAGRRVHDRGNQFISSSGLQLPMPRAGCPKGLGLSVVMGMLGGLYPAWRASRLVPMAAIRLAAMNMPRCPSPLTDSPGRSDNRADYNACGPPAPEVPLRSAAFRFRLRLRLRFEVADDDRCGRRPQVVP